MNEATADYHDLWYTSSDGLKLYARDYNRTVLSHPHRPVVLCLHGLTRNSADFAGIGMLLADQYRVIALDQRGRGRSEYDSEADNYNPLTYVQDTLGFIDHLGLSSINIIGTSMGGIMAMMMAAIRPELINALIINDIGPEVSKQGLDRLKQYVGKSEPVANWQAAAEQTMAINRIAFPDAQAADWMAFAKRLYREDEQGRPILAYDPAIAVPLNRADDSTAAPDLWPVFEQLQAVPMLLIRGVRSDILTPECAAEMRHKKSNMEFLDVPDVGHAPMLNEPISVQAIYSFLNKVNSRADRIVQH